MQDELASGESKKRFLPTRIVGAIAIETFQTQPDHGDTNRIEKCCECAADAFRNAFLHQRLFLFPIWNWLGYGYDFFVGRHLTKTAIATLIVLASIISSFFIQTEYRLFCNGEIHPESQRTVYAETDGFITSVHTDTGKSVLENQVLLTLENKGLLIRKQELQGNIIDLSQRIESIDRSSVSDPGDTAQLNEKAEQHAIERAVLQKQVEALSILLESLDRQIEMRTIKSPMAGIVLTTNMAHALTNRPVTRGAALFKIAETRGKWVVDLKLPNGQNRCAAQYAAAKRR